VLLTEPPRATKLFEMELTDLNQGERTALIGLMKLVVLSDRDVSEDEHEHIEALVDAFGEGEYQRTLDTFERQLADPAQFRDFLMSVSRQDARDLIFGTVLEAAGEGALEGREAELLDWLARAWNVKIEIADSVAD
jgi:hypothetical protein